MSEGWPELPKSMASSSCNRDTLDFLRRNFEPHEIEVLLEPSKKEKLLGGMFDFRYGRLHAEAAPVHFFAELGRDPITQAGVYIDKLVDQHGLAGNVVYIGDNLLTYALRFDLGLRDRVILIFLKSLNITISSICKTDGSCLSALKMTLHSPPTGRVKLTNSHKFCL